MNRVTKFWRWDWDLASVISVSTFDTIVMAGEYRTGRTTCYRCGKRGHFPNQCRFKDAYCYACGKKEHIALVCKSAYTGKCSSMQVCKKPGRQKSKINRVHGRYSNDLVHIHTLINGKRLRMELDTGAEVYIISKKTREEIFPGEKLRPSDLNLNKTYHWTNEGNRHTEHKGPVRGSVQEVGISGYSW